MFMFIGDTFSYVLVGMCIIFLSYSRPVLSQLSLLVTLKELGLSFAQVSGNLPGLLAFLPDLEAVNAQGKSIVGDLNNLFCISGQCDVISVDCLSSEVGCSCCAMCSDVNGANCEEH